MVGDERVREAALVSFWTGIDVLDWWDLRDPEERTLRLAVAEKAREMYMTNLAREIRNEIADAIKIKR